MTIRVSLIQPALPAYRIPVFRELASRDGIDLTVHYGQEQHLSNAEPDGFEAVPCPQKTVRIKGQPVIIVPRLLSLAKKKHSDVILVPWNVRWVLLRPAFARARRQGVGISAWGHGYSKSESPRRLAMRDALGCRADSLVFYNHTAADAFKERNPSHADSVFVAINSLDQTAIQAAREDWLSRPDDLAAFQREHRLDEASTGGGAVALFVSRLLDENRVDLLLEATARIRQQGGNLTSVIIGKGPDQPRLESIARKLGITDHVRFPGPIYGEPKIAPWFLSSQVFVYPVNIGLSVMHGLGYGLPVVTSDDIPSHNPEIEAVDNGTNAILYKDGDVDAMADAIRSITENPERQRTMSEAARATVLERFNVPKMADGLEAAIRHAAGKARK